jgi:hypothetical protein
MADGANYSRPTSMTYPNGRVITYGYGTSGSLNDSISRMNSITRLLVPRIRGTLTPWAIENAMKSNYSHSQTVNRGARLSDWDNKDSTNVDFSDTIEDQK